MVIKTIFLVHAASTLFMVGLIWFVQVVHYPLMARVSATEFVEYEAAHKRLTAWVVAPAMLTEGITALIILMTPRIAVRGELVWVGLALLIVIWFSTALLQVPQHNVLSLRFDSAAHQKLVATNWIRTIAWSLRGAIVLSFIP
ncbi:hypothetical protein GWO43_29415 [candidate division KSB1 bacterium]|nr:hypothetical protein [candidate division KSB1 bacterium]NIR69881.1 hypothetical protein [candidate division KSB1 bacterium]NIS28034.1 hypothetical protein [candidate division KSB1 bacterium]NIT74905.1 hypothetical protein [candidate division KSB1 bacterium]NIU28689.1 hypothetical protein [candidate division KSB1 bacterium]